MDSSNPSFDTSSRASLLQDGDRLYSLRRRNKALILVFFSLIIVLALTIGGIIISVVRKHKSQSRSPDPSPAIREFCAPSHSEFSCIKALFYDLKTPPNLYPDQIFVHTLETSARDLSAVISTASNGSRPGPDLGNCSSSLGHLGDVLGAMRVNPDLDTQTFERRGEMIEWINAAVEDLGSCARDLGRAESTGVMGLKTKVYVLEALLRFGRDFLVNCDVVNENFRFVLANEESSGHEVVENLIDASLFGSQYFVLVVTDLDLPGSRAALSSSSPLAN